MKYSLIFFFVLFSINNLLHYISEKVIIVIFITFLFFLMKLLSDIIDKEFTSKVEYILNDINIYMNVLFNFLYLNKLFYLNLKALKSNVQTVMLIVSLRLKKIRSFLLLASKLNKFNSSSTYFAITK